MVKRPPKARAGSTQVTAARKTIKSLETKPEHEALAAMFLGLAGAVDKDPSNAALWREYGRAEAVLREATSDRDDDASATFQLTVKTPRVQPTLGYSKDS